MVTENARARAVAALVERLNEAEHECDRLKARIATLTAERDLAEHRQLERGTKIAALIAENETLREQWKTARITLESLLPLCTHCAVATATKHTETDSPHDPLCQTCYSALWAVCATCGAEVLQDEIGSRETCPASMGGPAEYADACSHCAPEDSEPDYDAIRDEQEGL